MKIPRIICAMVASLAVYGQAVAFESSFTPRLNLREQYTDNLNRTSGGEEDDYISSVSPGCSFHVRGSTAGLTLSYDPEYVHYKEHDDRDQWRHYARLSGDWRLSRHTRFDLRHAFTISDDPVDDEGTSTVTGGVNKFTFNSTSFSLSSQFGRENTIEIGNNLAFHDYENDLVEDSRRLNPFLNYVYWFFDNNYGISFYAEYIRGEFEAPINISDDFNSYYGNLKLRKRFSPNIDLFLQHAYMHTDYEGDAENYAVHNPAIGVNYIRGERTNVSIALGYGIRSKEVTEDDAGLIVTGHLETSWAYSRGIINLSVYNGYTQNTFSNDNLGFYVYSNTDAGAEYRFARNFNGDVFTEYRYARYLDTEPQIEDHYVSCGAGLSYQMLSWLRLRMEYSHRNLNSTDDSREYIENRAILTATIEPATPFRLN
ncbi:MAG: outer membrane beta-barrel protein [Desulfatitalea sp.]|nr:outer membrane beta-barrel protein [Desulfatitalea sp.]